MNLCSYYFTKIGKNIEIYLFYERRFITFVKKINYENLTPD